MEETENKFIVELLEFCIKAKYSNDQVRDGLDYCLNFINKEMEKARRANFLNDKGQTE